MRAAHEACLRSGAASAVTVIKVAEGAADGPDSGPGIDDLVGPHRPVLPPARSGVRRFVAAWGPPLLMVAVLIGAWELWVVVRNSPPYVLPSPGRVAGAFGETARLLPRHILGDRHRVAGRAGGGRGRRVPPSPRCSPGCRWPAGCSNRSSSPARRSR